MIKISCIKTKNPKEVDCFIVRLDRYKENGERIFITEPLYFNEDSLNKVFKKIEEFIN